MSIVHRAMQCLLTYTQPTGTPGSELKYYTNMVVAPCQLLNGMVSVMHRGAYEFEIIEAAGCWNLQIDKKCGSISSFHSAS